MSFGIAGALMGAGDGLSKAALQMMEDRRRKMEMERAQKHDIDMLERKEAMLRGRPKRGGGGGGGSGGGTARKWTNSDDIRSNEAHNSFFGDDSEFEGDSAPSLIAFRLQTKKILEANPGMSRDEALQAAAQSWGPVMIPGEEERHPWSPARLGPNGTETYPVKREVYQWLNDTPVGGGGGAPPVGGGGGAGGGGGGFAGALEDKKGAPPAAAVSDLLANPDMAAEFDKKYGAGASAAYLRQ